MYLQPWGGPHEQLYKTLSYLTKKLFLYHVMSNLNLIANINSCKLGQYWLIVLCMWTLLSIFLSMNIYYISVSVRFLSIVIIVDKIISKCMGPTGHTMKIVRRSIRWSLCKNRIPCQINTLNLIQKTYTSSHNYYMFESQVFRHLLNQLLFHSSISYELNNVVFGAKFVTIFLTKVILK